MSFPAKKGILVSLVSIISFVQVLFAQITSEELLTLAPQLKKFIESQGGKVSLESHRDLGSLYEVVIKTPQGRIVGYVTRDFSYLFFGSLFDREGKNITQARTMELNRINLSQLNLADALFQKEGSGEKKIILFLDPFCPHCKSLVEYLKQKKDYAVYIFLLPLSDKSREAVLKILCSKLPPMEAYLNFSALETKDCAPEASRKLDTHIKVGLDLNVRGTPFVILQDGTNFYGFNRPLLEEYFAK